MAYQPKLQNLAKETPRQFLLRWYKGLMSKRSNFDSHWMEIAEMMQPRRARFFSSDSGVDGGKRNDKIINNEPLIALRVAAAGMMAGITSPARRWFRFTTTDPELGMFGHIREYLHQCEDVLLTIFAKSNFYTTLAGCTYPDLLVFGTHCSILEEDPDEVIRLYPLPIGEYVLMSNDKGVVDGMMREPVFTVRQIVRRFGLENCSKQVQQQYNEAQYEKTVNVVQCIMPNEDYQYGNLGPRGKKWISIWMEKSNEDDPETGFLRVSGYDFFPVLAPRWALTNSVSDVYGHSPGMEALGDAKELQHHEKKAMKLLDKLNDPPMNIPEDLRASSYSLLPGALNYTPRNAGQGNMAQPAMTVQPQALVATDGRISAISIRVGKAFYADLWLQIINDSRAQPRTAREIDERHEEKMLQLGPVVNRAEKELLNPAIDLGFYHAQLAGLMPDPPSELLGAPLGIEYLSVMSQAQRLVNVASSERFMSFVIASSQSFPEALDVVDIDKVCLDMANVLGLSPEFLRDEKAIDQIRQARAQRNQQQMQAAQMAQGAKTVKDLAGASPDGDVRGLASELVGPVAGTSAGMMPPYGSNSLQ
jgi:hypothetical protein